MAPLVPSRRVSSRKPIRTRNPRNHAGNPSQTDSFFDADDQAAFTTTKKDKQRIKHSLLMSKLQKTRGSGISKRRRPTKKLVANLESLVDALPEVTALPVTAEEVAAARLKSVGSKPGSAKKKAKIVEEERQRFGMNMATLSRIGAKQSAEKHLRTPATATESTAVPTNERWAALRQALAANMGVTANTT